MGEDALLEVPMRGDTLELRVGLGGGAMVIGLLL